MVKRISTVSSIWTAGAVIVCSQTEFGNQNSRIRIPESGIEKR
jgi:hypothetical protein